MNLLEIMNVRTESCETMKRDEAEAQQKKMQSLQDIICKCKKLLNMQAQAMAQKDAKIYQLEKLCQEKDETHARLMKLKDIEIQNLEWKMKDERSSHQYASYRLREVEEELADVKKQIPWWKKRKKKSKLYSYKRHWWQGDRIKANLGLGIILAGYICVVWWLFKWSLGW